MKTILTATFMLLLLCSCGSKTGFTYTTKANKHLYNHVDNPLVIKTTGKDTVIINIPYATVTKKNDTLYNVRIEGTKTAVLGSISQGSHTKKIWFRFKNIPQPVLMFRGKIYKDMTIPVADFKQFPMELRSIIPDFEYDMGIDIGPFTAIRIGTDNRTWRFEIKNGRLEELAARATPGDIVIFKAVPFMETSSGAVFGTYDYVFTLK